VTTDPENLCFERGPVTGARCTEGESHNTTGADHVAATGRTSNGTARKIEQWSNTKKSN
jgi:hypothetical protein